MLKNYKNKVAQNKGDIKYIQYYKTYFCYFTLQHHPRLLSGLFYFIMPAFNTQYLSNNQWSIIILFYCGSTMERQSQISSPHPILSPIVCPKPQAGFVYHSQLFSVQFIQLSKQLLQITNALNYQLFKNNTLTQQYSVSQLQAIKQEKKDSQNYSTSSRKNTSQNNFQNKQERDKEVTQEKQKKKKQIEISSSEEYRPEDEFSGQNTHTKISESKNIPKNYGKAIFSFIRRNENFVRRVLDHLHLDYEDFMIQSELNRVNLNTIAQLRSIWIDKQNRFAKAYRIFSIEYLRKHSLSYIFNSRVQNFGKHIKYRYKIIQSVSKPQSFTCMKQF